MESSRQIRVKLFISIFTALLVAFSLITYLAYQGAYNNFLKNQNGMLTDYADQLYREFKQEAPDDYRNPQTNRWLATNNSQAIDIRVLLHSGEQIIAPGAPQLPEQLLTLEDFSTASPNELEYEDTRYTVHHFDINSKSSSGKLVITHIQAADSTLDFWRALGIPFVITVAITLWMSGWLAMFLAALFEKLHIQKEKLKHQALHDPLTGLPNRALMNDRLEQAILTAERDRAQVALLFIDLNFFKNINDSLGHSFGDALLIELASRLQSVVRKSDTVSRLGGDEFAIVLRNIKVESAQFVATKVLKAIEKVVEVETNKLYVSASIGISLYPTHAVKANTLVNQADIAMYSAKKSGNNIVIYNTELDTSSRERLQLINDLRESMRTQSVEVWYQPVVDLKGEKLYAIEALLRWSHPAFGKIDARRFTEIAEHSGLMKPLTEYMLRIAFRDFRQLKSQALAERLQLNISIANLQDGDFIPNLLDTMQQFEIETKDLVLEVAEKTMAAYINQSTNTLTKLIELGFHIVVDDFGTSYSSLSNLQTLHIGGIKIHDALVRAMLQNEQTNSIIKAAVQLGHALKLDVFAEGVENEKTLRMLNNYGCSFAQGHIFAEALPLAALSDWIEKLQQKPEIFKLSGR